MSPPPTLPVAEEEEDMDVDALQVPNASNGKEDKGNNNPAPSAPGADQAGPSRGGSSSGTRGGRGGRSRGRGGSNPSSYGGSYSNAASAPRNYLIHVYKLQDDLIPFAEAMEFYTLREVIKKAIWASYEEHGIDRDLAVAGCGFKKESDHKPAGIGLIFCDSEARQKRVIQLILEKNLDKHIVKSDPSLA
jgi:hypothetical protein